MEGAQAYLYINCFYTLTQHFLYLTLYGYIVHALVDQSNLSVKPGSLFKPPLSPWYSSQLIPRKMKTFTVVSLLCASVISCSEIVAQNNEQQHIVIPVVPNTPDGQSHHYEGNNIIADVLWAPNKIAARKIKQGDDYYSASMISYYNKDGVRFGDVSKLVRNLELDFEDVKENKQNNEDEETEEYKVEEID